MPPLKSAPVEICSKTRMGGPVMSCHPLCQLATLISLVLAATAAVESPATTGAEAPSGVGTGAVRSPATAHALKTMQNVATARKPPLRDGDGPRAPHRRAGHKPYRTLWLSGFPFQARGVSPAPATTRAVTPARAEPQQYGPIVRRDGCYPKTYLIDPVTGDVEIYCGNRTTKEGVASLPAPTAGRPAPP